MRSIPLTKGRVALVDDSDFDEISQFTWYAVERRHCCYAARYAYEGGDGSGARGARGTQFSVFMHRQITKAPAGLYVDHRNGDGLLNTRENLRTCTPSQNQHNRRHFQTGKSSRFIGVVWDRRRNKWMAHIKDGGKTIFLGRFVDETDAAAARDCAAIKLFGEFASTNAEVVIR